MRLLSFRLIGIFFFTIIFPAVVFAGEGGEKLDASLCTRHFASYEKAFNIPDNLLKAVAIVESGLIGKKGQNAVPWPWTFNVQGKGYFFKTKQEAITAVRAFQRNGQSSIDVGCMQINLYYHPNAFHSLEEAFDPKTNISYAANFLQNNFTKHNNWKGAVAAYHSETPSLGHPYAQKVLAVWQKTPTGDAANYASITSEGRYFNNNRSPLYSNASLSYLSPRMKARRNSNMMISVQRPSTSVYAKYNAEKVAMVENITQNALHNFNKGKQLKPVTFID